MKKQTKPKVGERCPCADGLNFGEPQPDCSRCGGSGRVRRPDADVGPTFNWPKGTKKP